MWEKLTKANAQVLAANAILATVFFIEFICWKTPPQQEVLNHIHNINTMMVMGAIGWLFGSSKPQK